MSKTRRDYKAQEASNTNKNSVGISGRPSVFISFNISDAHMANEPFKRHDIKKLAENILINGYKYGLLKSAGNPSAELIDEQAESLVEILSQDDGIGWLSHAGLEQDSNSAPPLYGERLLYLLLSKEERENLIGDLAEEYAALRAKHGSKFGIDPASRRPRRVKEAVRRDIEQS